MHRTATATLGPLIWRIGRGHVNALDAAPWWSSPLGSCVQTHRSLYTGCHIRCQTAGIASNRTGLGSNRARIGSYTTRFGAHTTRFGSTRPEIGRWKNAITENPCIWPASVSSTRNFSTSSVVSHNHIHKPKEGEELHVTFISKDGSQQTFEVAEGDNILDIAQSYNLDMEGACGGSCACSTCHVIIDPEFYDEIEEPGDDENDMLDLAFGLTETSRLGCQIKMTKSLDGIRIALPAMTRNLQSRDFN